jgi:hypothetical protein
MAHACLALSLCQLRIMHIRLTPLGLGKDDDDDDGAAAATGMNRTATAVMYAAVAIIGALVLAHAMSSWLVLFPVTSSGCDDDNACTVDLKVGPVGQRYCVHESAPTDQGCTASKCYYSGAPAHCNGRGACIADDPLTCKGLCTDYTGSNPYVYPYSGCDPSLIPLRPYFSGGFNIGDTIIYPSFVPDGMGCFAGRCFRMVFQSLVEHNVNYLAWAGSLMSCEEMLDTSDPNIDTKCIQTREILVDTASAAPLMNNVYNTGNDWLGRLCIFHYACARVNTTLLGVVSGLALAVANGTTSARQLPPRPTPQPPV